MINLKKLTDKIQKRISEYIEFDVNELLQVSDFITIYGGAVRDSIADMDIHDVDILCMSDSAYKLRDFIRSKYGYEYLDLYDQDSLNMYRGITLIQEPWTFMNKNKKIIQIIRPVFYTSPNNTINKIDEYKNAYINLIKNVDISACGVFIENINNKIILKESCKNAIIHCLSKSFEINEWSSQFKKDRTEFRSYKLKSRGWIDINKRDLVFNTVQEDIKYLQKEREIKILSLEFEPEYDYIVWNENDYVIHKMLDDIDDEFMFS